MEIHQTIKEEKPRSKNLKPKLRAELREQIIQNGIFKGNKALTIILYNKQGMETELITFIGNNKEVYF